MTKLRGATPEQPLHHVLAPRFLWALADFYPVPHRLQSIVQKDYECKMANQPLRYRKTYSLQGHDIGIAAVAFSAYATFLATSGLDGQLCIWDVQTGRLSRVFKGDTAILSLVWLPYGEDSVVVGYQDGNVAILSLSSVSTADSPFTSPPRASFSNIVP